MNFCGNAIRELGKYRPWVSTGRHVLLASVVMLRNRVTILVAGALRLDVSRLLALVADLLTTSGLLGAVTGVVARLAAVVALHAVDTLACSLRQSNDKPSG